MVVAHSEMRRKSTLEHMVDRLLASLLPVEREDTDREVRRSIHDARRARRSGAVDEALARLSGPDLSLASADMASWAYREWLTIVRQRYGTRSLLLYRAGHGRVAVVELGPDLGTVRVVAVLGIRWEPGRLLSRRCLRGLAPLKSHGSYHGSVSCS